MSEIWSALSALRQAPIDTLYRLVCSWAAFLTLGGAAVGVRPLAVFTAMLRFLGVPSTGWVEVASMWVVERTAALAPVALAVSILFLVLGSFQSYRTRAVSTALLAMSVYGEAGGEVKAVAGWVVVALVVAGVLGKAVEHHRYAGQVGEWLLDRAGCLTRSLITNWFFVGILPVLWFIGGSPDRAELGSQLRPIHVRAAGGLATRTADLGAGEAAHH